MTFRRQLSTIVLLWRSGLLVRNGNPAKVLRLAAAKAGLTSDDYAAPERLRRKLTAYLEGMPGPLAVAYVSTLAGALGMLRRNLDGLRVYEAFLDIGAGDYADAGALRDKIRRRSDGLPDEAAATLVFSLIGNLGVLGRESEGVKLLRVDLGLDPSGPDQDRAALRRDLEAGLVRRLAGLAPDAVAAYLSLLVPYLDSLGVGADGAAIVEACLGLRPDDYLSGQRLGARLDPLLQSLTTREAPVSMLMSLAALLGEAGQHDKAIALLEWYVDADATDYRDANELGRKWRVFRDRNNSDIGLTLWRVWSDLLAEAGRSDDVLALLEADSGVQVADLAVTERFGPKLAHRLRRVQVDTAAAYLLSLAYDLVSLGYAEQAGLITDWYLRGYGNLWHVPDDGDPGVRHVIPLVALWLELRSAHQPDFAWRLSGQAVAYLRRSLLIEDLQLADRREFVGYVDSLRGQIKRVGYSWTEHTIESPDDEARVLQAQLWDAELGQRALFEEFLLTKAEPVAQGSPPQDHWPYADDEPVGEGPPVFLGLSSEDLSRLLAEEYPASPPLGDTQAGATALYDADWTTEAWLRDAEQLVRQGVTQELLAEALGSGTVLVRAGFRPGDGALAWAAMRIGDDQRARVIAAGPGAHGDRVRAHWASLRHDLGMQMATATKPEEPQADPSSDGHGLRAESQGDRLATVLAATVNRVTEILNEVISTGRSAGEWIETVAGYLAALNSGPSSIAGRGCIGTRIRELLPLPPDPSGQQSWLHFARSELEKLAESARRHLRLTNGMVGVPDEIDDVTRAYLAEMADIWPLGSLADDLNQDTDVVFQLEDVLQQVPVAHYPFMGGVPLYSMVRSTRVSLSVLVTIMQSRIERQFVIGARRMLALSYFTGNDISGQLARLLHYGHRWLARESHGAQLTCLNAAEVPPGSTGALQAALRSGAGFQTVTVCGHGLHAEDLPGTKPRDGVRSGIRLQDGLWSGAGCDLRSVNFLLLPSCSMGRLRQVEDGDVAGMCTLLALNRARSVLACRWPVITDQAIAFTHEVVASYLTLSAQADDQDGGSSLRARAVNTARHRFLGGTGTPVAARTVLLNTVAAFELFGLG